MLSLHNLPNDIVTHTGDRSVADCAGFFQLREQRIAAFEREYLTTLSQCYQDDVAQAAREAFLPRGTL
jgi:hypothetical protein